MNDDISAFFESLTPQDFLVETSASREGTLSRPRSGQEDFDRFVDTWLDTVRTAYDSSEGAMNPIAVLQRPHGYRIYHPDDDESNKMFLDRVAREARQWKAHWFFAALSAHATVGEHHDVSDNRGIDQARRSSRLQPTINWYAETVEPGCEEALYGVITIDTATNKTKEVRLGRYIEGASPLFRQVMASDSNA